MSQKEPSPLTLFCLFILLLVCRLCTLAAGAEVVSETEEPVLPARYDSRDFGKGTMIKSQGEVNTCWALTATSALEAALLPEDHCVFSAEHMVYNNGFTTKVSDGGDAHMIMAYLSGWYGPVMEEADPYGDDKTDPDAPAAAHVL